MDQEIDLMLQKKSQVIETGKQEYRLPGEKPSPGRPSRQSESLVPYWIAPMKTPAFLWKPWEKA